MHVNISDSDRPFSVHGPVALVGSGEYTPAMEETDRYLLSLIGGAASARVACGLAGSGSSHSSRGEGEGAKGSPDW